MEAIYVLAIILLLWYLSISAVENYRSCRGCDDSMPQDGVVVLNPFIWPYSATGSVDDLYIANKDSKLDLGFGMPPVSLNTPDHVVMTN